MSQDKEKINQLMQKVDDTLIVLSKIQEDLRQISASMKSLAVGQITAPQTHAAPGAAPIPASAPQTAPPRELSKQRTVDDIRMSFPEELEVRLSFEDKGEFIIIKPKQFLGSENFAKIASAARGMGGEYISSGKDSHFRVPKKKA